MRRRERRDSGARITLWSGCMGGEGGVIHTGVLKPALTHPLVLGASLPPFGSAPIREHARFQSSHAPPSPNPSSRPDSRLVVSPLSLPPAYIRAQIREHVRKRAHWGCLAPSTAAGRFGRRRPSRGAALAQLGKYVVRAPLVPVVSIEVLRGRWLDHRPCVPMTKDGVRRVS